MKIRIKNFKSHRDNEIELCNGITGIFGISCSGKTNIVRAIQWFRRNWPLKFKFHSKFAENEKTSVLIKLDGRSGTSTKTPKTHIYKLDSQEFRKIGRNVPEPVNNFLNLSEANFQTQFESSFLLHAKPSTIAQVISQAAKTDIIEKSKIKIKKRYNELNSEKKVTSADVESIKLEIEALEELDDLAPKIKKLKKIERKADSLEEEKTFFEDALEKIANLQEDIKIGEESLKLKSKIKEIERVEYRKQTLIDEKNLIIETIKLKEEIEKLERKKKIKINKYIKQLKTKGKCPMCLSNINQKAIKRIKDEIRSA